VTLWIVFGVLCLVAIGFAVWPLYRAGGRVMPLAAVLIVGVVALSFGLYYIQGNPEVPTHGAGGSAEMDDVIAALVARLEENPEDLNGWKMLGRTYMALGNFPGAVDAYEKANDLESGRNAQTLVSLGEANMAAGGGEIMGAPSALFESALAIDPNNPQALFYAGIVAFNRDDPGLAANRWERLLSLNPPAEIEGILRQRIAEWRGEATPAAGAPPVAERPAPETSPPAEVPGAIVTVNLSVSAEAAAALPADAGIFVIARDPAQPSPPIAVARTRVAELPVNIGLSDRDSMVPGRSLSLFPEFEIVARVSLGGQPTEQSGDWYGSRVVVPAESGTVALVIDTQVP
jgi:cytochrome c-type biogenesis protein CcmH